MGAPRCDFGAFWAAFRCESFEIYVMVGCRGGCSGGLPAVLGLDFHEKSCFCKINFCVFGGVRESPRVGFGRVWARFDAISVRIVRNLRYGGISRGLSRKSAGGFGNRFS